MSVNAGSAAQSASTPHASLLIDGKWVSATQDEAIEIVDPTTEAVIATVDSATDRDVDRSVEAARRALESPSWNDLRPAQRARILMKLADLLERDADALARLESRNMGMPLFLSRGADIPTAIAELRYNAGWCERIGGETFSLANPGEFHAYTLREPVGVVGAIVPWNFPLLMAVVKLAPALAAGCTVVLKPAEETPLTALRLGELALEAGLPPGVLNIVTGYGHGAGAALAAHPRIDKITFTGSTEVGRSIVGAARGNLKKLTLELGGKSPTLILADAHLEKAIPAAAASIFTNSGQICSAGSRIYADAKIARQVLEGIARIARDHRPGAWDDPNSTLGPLVSSRHFDRVSQYVVGATREGAQLVTGGERVGSRGYFFSPTVIRTDRNDLTICQEEVFGPVVVVQETNSVEEMIRFANDTRYGLSAAIWTGDLARGHRLARALRSGSVWINTAGAGDPCFPCGGVKESGWGRERGREGIDAYLQTKSVGCAL